MSLQDRIAAVRAEIARDKVASSVTLVAVTKTLSLPETEAAVMAGLTHLGENRLQVAEPKIKALSNDSITWHFLGPVQSNKAKKIVELFSVIHSISSWSTLDAVNKAAESAGKKPDIFLEINISGEASKHGFTVAEIKLSIHKVLDYSSVNFLGYMTMAPFTQDESIQHSVFYGLKSLADELRDTQRINYSQLSMGMSNDYKVALKDGATMVRLGTALFS
jgi:pyridoxal phosphate enzyme (YggS family)